MPENVRKMSDEEPMSDGGSASPVSRASTNPSPSAELEAVSPKHPLQSDWTLWYFKNDKSKSWDANLKSVSNKYNLKRFMFGHILLWPFNNISNRLSVSFCSGSLF